MNPTAEEKLAMAEALEEQEAQAAVIRAGAARAESERARLAFEAAITPASAFEITQVLASFYGIEPRTAAEWCIDADFRALL